MIFSAISIDDAAAIDEGQEAVFTVSLDQAPLAGRDLTVDVTTVDGTAEAGSDFDSLSQTLTFTSTGPLTQEIRIQTIDDTIVESTEVFTVQIGNPVNGFVLDSIGDGTILSDDVAPIPVISIADAAAIFEGQAAVFTVSIDRDPQSVVSVSIRTNDISAVSPGDCSGIVSRQLTFHPGESLTQTVSVATTDDLEIENTETFTLDQWMADPKQMAVLTAE